MRKVREQGSVIGALLVIAVVAILLRLISGRRI